MKNISKWLFWTLVAAMLVFTSFRTGSFIMSTLPASSQIIGFFGLAAFDGGLIGWALIYQHHARGQNQRAIALVMTGISFCGLAASNVADTFIEAARNRVTGHVDGEWVAAAIWVTIFIVLAHVAAGVIFHLCDPKLAEKRAEEDLQDQIEQEARKMAARDVKVLAAQLAPTLAQHTLSQMSTRYLSSVQPAPAIAPPNEAKKTSSQKTAPLYFSADGGEIEPEEEAGPDNGQSPFSRLIKK